jgi:hypothetical protein
MTSNIAYISNWDSSQEVANTEKGLGHWPTGSYSLLFSDYPTFKGHTGYAACGCGVDAALFMIPPGNGRKRGHQSWV